ncbi:MAG: hypothetical protein QOE70_2245 [Chthoniobacter sp.]|jgi:anti-sigma-K factor RskA|nr:hypothetical protein [Chthoniobacter sp.]
MIDEASQDLAIQYVLGTLDTAGERAFEAELRADYDLLAFVNDLRESTALLALAAPAVLPPPHLRAKVLAIVPAAAAPPGPALARHLAWLPWAIAASLAVGCVILFSARERSRAETQRGLAQSERWRAEAESGRSEVEKSREEATKLREKIVFLESQSAYLEKQTNLLKTEIAAVQAEPASLRNEIALLKGRDALAQIRIAALSAQVTRFAKAGAVVLWDSEKQRGIVKLVNLPKPEAGKDYQIWVIDPIYPTPISGGVVPVGADGAARVSFKPDQFIATPDKFAISVEKAGGATTVAGPIVFMGN